MSSVFNVPPVEGQGGGADEGGQSDEGRRDPWEGSNVPAAVQKTITDLRASRRDAEDRAQQERQARIEQQNEILAIKEQLQALQQRGSSNGDARTTWDSVSSDDLQRLTAEQLSAIVQQGEDGEGGQFDPNVTAKAIREMIRREVSSARNEVSEEMNADRQYQQALMAVNNKVVRTWPEAADESSEFRQRAEAKWAEVEKKYTKQGAEELRRAYPEMNYDIFAATAAEMAAEGKGPLAQTVMAGPETRRRPDSVDSGGGVAAEQANAYTAALREGDVRSAAKMVASQLFGAPRRESPGNYAQALSDQRQPGGAPQGVPAGGDARAAIRAARGR